MNRFLSVRTLSSSVPVWGQGSRFSGKVRARHQGQFKNNVNQEFEMAPGEQNRTGHIMDHLKVTFKKLFNALN